MKVRELKVLLESFDEDADVVLSVIEPDPEGDDGWVHEASGNLAKITINTKYFPNSVILTTDEDY